jgi:hypothetical protein
MEERGYLLSEKRKETRGKKEECFYQRAVSGLVDE